MCHSASNGIVGIEFDEIRNLAKIWRTSYIFGRFSKIGGLDEDWMRIGGELEEDWSRLQRGLDEDWKHIFVDFRSSDVCGWIVLGLVTPQDGLATPSLWGLRADLFKNVPNLSKS